MNMKKILNSLFVALVVTLVATSCKTPQNIAYIKNSDSIDYAKSEFLYDAHIMPKDILMITVNTVNPAASAPFNLPVQHAVSLNSSDNVSSAGSSVQTYLVDNEGCIDFPVVGRLEVKGLTKSQCEKLVHDKILRYMNAEENPIVTVRMSNYKISVLGEVGHPGMFTVSNEKITIFEALAQAGDLTIFGVRERVKLIREDAKGRKEIHTINLNDANIVNSPYYYLQQNDVVYVEPNTVKAKTSSFSPSTTLWVSMSSALVSLASLVVNILR